MREVAVLLALTLGGCASLSGVFGGPAGAPHPAKFPSSSKTPYASTAAYFGSFAPGSAPDTDPDELPARYLYVWLPNAAPELGVRVVSPVLGWTTRQDGDFADPDFDAHASDATAFDPTVRLERCVNAMNPEDILTPCEYWAALGENDDSAELPPQGERGPKVNALVRAVSEPDEPLRALIRGVYRIAIWAGKDTPPGGTYWVQVGAARELSGIVIARTPAALSDSVPQ